MLDIISTSVSQEPCITRLVPPLFEISATHYCAHLRWLFMGIIEQFWPPEPGYVKITRCKQIMINLCSEIDHNRSQRKVNNMVLTSKIGLTLVMAYRAPAPRIPSPPLAIPLQTFPWLFGCRWRGRGVEWGSRGLEGQETMRLCHYIPVYFLSFPAVRIRHN